jgi:catechol 2,3-dioxygenase-like lactoylglutathione lyase family enzyme
MEASIHINESGTLSAHPAHAVRSWQTALSPDCSVLHAELNAALAYGPAYEGEMASHLPMALHAAWALGAGPAHLQRLRQVLQHPLQPAPEASGADHAWVRDCHERGHAWTSRLGERNAYAAYRLYFERCLSAPGSVGSGAHVLSLHLPQLLKGWHAFAFHGLIRTAHAWEGGYMPELAAALATWAAWWEPLETSARQRMQPLGPLASSDSAADPLAQWLNELPQQAGAWRSTRRMIAERLREAQASEAYSRALSAAPAGVGVSRWHGSCLEWSRDAYLSGGNFTVLHLITGLRAWAVLWPLSGLACAEAGTGGEAEHLLASGVLAGYLASGAASGPVSKLGPAQETPNRPQALARRALARADEHALKTVHAALALAAEGEPALASAWMGVAEMALHRLQPELQAFDHVHIHVADRTQALVWYERVLGMRPVPELAFWMADGGPLTVRDASGQVHLALFQRPLQGQTQTVAFRVSGHAYLAWKDHLSLLLEDQRLVEEDHHVSRSLYFRDPDGNPFEITTYEPMAT